MTEPVIVIRDLTPDQAAWPWNPHPVAWQRTVYRSRYVYQCARADGYYARLVEDEHAYLAGPYATLEALEYGARLWCSLLKHEGRG